jgi:hypothetical protein
MEGRLVPAAVLTQHADAVVAVEAATGSATARASWRKIVVRLPASRPCSIGARRLLYSGPMARSVLPGPICRCATRGMRHGEDALRPSTRGIGSAPRAAASSIASWAWTERHPQRKPRNK